MLWSLLKNLSLFLMMITLSISNQNSSPNKNAVYQKASYNYLLFKGQFIVDYYCVCYHNHHCIICEGTRVLFNFTIKMKKRNYLKLVVSFNNFAPDFYSEAQVKEKFYKKHQHLQAHTHTRTHTDSFI